MPMMAKCCDVYGETLSWYVHAYDISLLLFPVVIVVVDVPVPERALVRMSECVYVCVCVCDVI